ncbi:hypothetical protein S7711_10486 [Stachybotrys chartarum IBT 7711]|uniref:Uncharacterized protein n=1 Tax=Stachybotrys chartarum (strain CBS 109288 / IBT 7711) TaxID=1280523 RepID=A0A084BC75_STACB|nr:hypothetical protein S7711_10486 [Stachybotrys chartarum IBT 7711]KFA80057.1 hypothetical protein S40288_10652 [Stachybotrys chartarum IBT 40288]
MWSPFQGENNDTLLVLADFEMGTGPGGGLLRCAARIVACMTAFDAERVETLLPFPWFVLTPLRYMRLNTGPRYLNVFAQRYRSDAPYTSFWGKPRFIVDQLVGMMFDLADRTPVTVEIKTPELANSEQAFIAGERPTLVTEQVP